MASQEGKKKHEVVTAEGLTIRIVNSMVKKCETKPRFHETFGPEGNPSEFAYRQRVLLLFQKLDGVDVCIFCMWVICVCACARVLALLALSCVCASMSRVAVLWAGVAAWRCACAQIHVWGCV